MRYEFNSQVCEQIMGGGGRGGDVFKSDLKFDNYYKTTSQNELLTYINMGFSRLPFVERESSTN